MQLTGPARTTMRVCPSLSNNETSTVPTPLTVASAWKAAVSPGDIVNGNCRSVSACLQSEIQGAWNPTPHNKNITQVLDPAHLFGARRSLVPTKLQGLSSSFTETYNVHRREERVSFDPLWATRVPAPW